MTSVRPVTKVVAADGLPLSFRVAPLRAFVEVGLAPGQPIRAVEVQQVQAGFGPATIVLAHRPDGTIDLMVSDRRLDEAWFHQDPCMSHMPLGRIATATFDRNHIILDDRSIEVDVSVEAEQFPGRLTVSARHTFARPGRPSFVPAVPGTGPRPTLRLIMAGSVRGLPRSADPVIKLDGRQLDLAPLATAGPLVLARPARVGTDVFGVGLNLTGTTRLAGNGDASSALPAGPVVLAVGRGRHRLALRLLTDGGEPVDAAEVARPTHRGGVTTGRLVIDGSLGSVVTGRWVARVGSSDDNTRSSSSSEDTVELRLDEVAQRWRTAWWDPVGVAQDLIRRRRRNGQTWRWDGQWRGSQNGIVIHTGRWTVLDRQSEVA